MSRGPGVWQRKILDTTSGTLVACVSGIVRTSVVSPDRDDFTSARRAAKQLALAERVNAVYAWCCTKCMRIQDRDDPVPCCGPVRPLLAVCMPERRRLLLHPAPPPSGSAPSWINVAVPSRPQGQLLAPGVADLASLVIRRLWERLEAGEASVSLQDAAALLRLAREIERDDAVAAGAAARARAEMFQRGLASTLWTAKRHIDPAKWRAFIDDLRRECESFAPRDTPSPGRRKTRRAGHLITEKMLRSRGDAAMRHDATTPLDRLVPPVETPG